MNGEIKEIGEVLKELEEEIRYQKEFRETFLKHV